MVAGRIVSSGPFRCIKANEASVLVLQSLRHHSLRWQEAEARLAAFAPHIAAFLQDLFYAFYDPDPQLNTDVNPTEAWGFALLAALMALREFIEFKERMQGDVIACASAALYFAHSLADALADSEAPSSKSVRQRLLRVLPRRRPIGQEPVAAGHPLPQDEASIRFLVGRSLRRARAALAHDENLRQAWGVHPGARGVHAFDDVWSLLDEVRSLPGFAELTDALGRFQGLLKPSLPRRHKRRGEVGRRRIAGYTRGRELERVVPEELVRLTDPVMADLFREAYDHRRLTLFDYTGEEPHNCGPLICCMDTSASMNQPAALGRERFVWCKGLGLALFDFAHKSQRPYLGLCFSSESELEAFAAPAGSFDPRLALAMAKCDFNGGTHFERPLRHALAYAQGNTPVKAKGAKAAGADLVFVADGEASLGSAFLREFLREKAAARLRLFTVLIDGSHDGLAALSDAVFTVRSDRLDSWEAAVLSVGRQLAGA